MAIKIVSQTSFKLLKIHLCIWCILLEQLEYLISIRLYVSIPSPLIPISPEVRVKSTSYLIFKHLYASFSLPWP